MKIKSLILLLILVFLCSCKMQKGQFAFQTPLDKSFKINQARMEFDSSWDVKWMYKFTPVAKEVKLGILIMKKELGWIDVLSMPESINETKTIIYGSIKDFEPGDYKIVITVITEDETIILDECYFYLYSDEETLD